MNVSDVPRPLRRSTIYVGSPIFGRGRGVTWRCCSGPGSHNSDQSPLWKGPEFFCLTARTRAIVSGGSPMTDTAYARSRSDRRVTAGQRLVASNARGRPEVTAG